MFDNREEMGRKRTKDREDEPKKKEAWFRSKVKSGGLLESVSYAAESARKSFGGRGKLKVKGNEK